MAYETNPNAQIGSPSAAQQFTVDPAVPTSLTIPIKLAFAGRWRMLIRNLGTGSTQDIPSPGISMQESPLYNPAPGATIDTTRYGASNVVAATLAHGTATDVQPPAAVPDAAASALLTIAAPSATTVLAIELAGF